MRMVEGEEDERKRQPKPSLDSDERRRNSWAYGEIARLLLFPSSMYVASSTPQTTS